MVCEIWKYAIPAGLANTDIITGPVLPANTYLVDLLVDWDTQGATGTFKAGYASHTADFIATANTTPQAGGVARANVGGSIGFTATTDTTILLTMTATSASPTGYVRIALLYTANP